MRNKVASIAIAGALAFGVAAPAPAVAVTASSQQTAEAFTQNPVAAILEWAGFVGPFDLRVFQSKP
ncbi:hypothetical protein, partial [Corynebacterium casei]|uniref:hypothetical protein n=1 Tax=Corynebacterium casei TaxID=160386 RepID=UPI003FD3E40F